MNTTRQKGFAPLIVIIVLGITLATGGAIAVVSINKQHPVQTPPKEEEKVIFEEVGEVPKSTEIVTSEVSKQIDPIPVITSVTQVPASSTITVEQKQVQKITDQVVEPIQVSENKALSEDPRISVINALLDNLTVEELSNFCNKAKELDSWGTKQELSDDRTTIVETTPPLYKKFWWCSFIFNEGIKEGLMITWYTYSDEDFLVPLLGNDTDANRMLKISYNTKVKELGRYKLLGLVHDKRFNVNPSEAALVVINSSLSKSIKESTIFSQLLVPGKDLEQAKKMISTQ